MPWAMVGNGAREHWQLWQSRQQILCKLQIYQES